MTKQATAAACVALSLLSASLSAKGTTNRIVVTGPGLATPLSLTDAAVVEANPWRGNFMDSDRGYARAPAATRPIYTLAFYVDLPGAAPSSAPALKYVVYYVPGSGSTPGLIHLPGRDDRWYRLNIATIMRNGDEGNWFYASPRWDHALAALLAAQVRPDARAVRRRGGG
jgi:hypothetical protein